MIIEKTMKKTNYSKPDIVVVKQWDERQFMPTASGKNTKMEKHCNRTCPSLQSILKTINLYNLRPSIISVLKKMSI